jgi:hypothetical protein
LPLKFDVGSKTNSRVPFLNNRTLVGSMLNMAATSGDFSPLAFNAFRIRSLISIGVIVSLSDTRVQGITNS